MNYSHPTAAFWRRTTLVAALLLLIPLCYGSSFGSLNASALRLRAEPNLSAPALALISTADENGSLSGAFGSLYDETQNSAPALSEATLLAYVNTGDDVLNIRSGPGTAYTTVGQAKGGTILPVFSNENGWCSVLYDDKPAYVCADYVRLMTQEEATSASAPSSPTADTLGGQIVQEAQTYLGRPYVYGGNGPNSFDCSGFTKYVYAQFGYTLNRTAADQLSNGSSVDRSELAPGDLIFFRSAGTTKLASHVGIYIGDDSFIHASTNNYQIRIDSLSADYYSDIFVGARRLA